MPAVRPIAAPSPVTVACLLMAAGIGMSAGGCNTSTKKRVESSNSILAVFAPMSPAEAAAMMVDPFDADARYRGMTLIANAPFGGETAYLNVYRDAVKNDQDMGVRGVAARALGMHGSPEDALLIMPLLKNEDQRVRLEAARALQRLYNPAVLPDLLPLVDWEKEKNRDVRQVIADGLAEYRDRRALAALINALRDDELAVSRTARMSLRTLTGKDFKDDVRAWTQFADAAPDPFASALTYNYPVYHRSKYLYEYIPLVPPPPNEPASIPVGYPRPMRNDEPAPVQKR